jgi:tagaturonate reductase
MERFENPYIRHELLSIALNSVSKWKARVLPSVKDVLEKTGMPPRGLSFSLAALMEFYAKEYKISRDDEAVLAFFNENRTLPVEKLTQALLGRADFWGEDLNALPGFAGAVSGYLQAMRDKGVRKAVLDLLARAEAKA